MWGGVGVIMYVAPLSAILVIPNSCFFMVMKVLHQCELRVVMNKLATIARIPVLFFDFPLMPQLLIHSCSLAGLYSLKIARIAESNVSSM